MATPGGEAFFPLAITSKLVGSDISRTEFDWDQCKSQHQSIESILTSLIGVNDIMRTFTVTYGDAISESIESFLFLLECWKHLIFFNSPGTSVNTGLWNFGR